MNSALGIVGKRRVRRLVLAASALALGGLLSVNSAQALTYTWAGGAGATWDTTDTNWGGGGATPWDATNGVGNIAYFNTASATATVSGTVYTNGITFDSTATISGGPSIFINLAGTTPTITTNADAMIGSSISGSAGLIKSGTGRLKLIGSNPPGGTSPSGANTYTGGTVVNGGRLSFIAETGLGAVPASTDPTNITLKNGAILELTYLTDTDNTGSSVTLDAKRGIYLDTGIQVLQRNHRGQNFGVNGVISGPGGLVLSTLLGGDQGGGSGFDINGANTYAGDTYFGWPSGQSKGNLYRINNTLALQNSTVNYVNYYGYSENISRENTLTLPANVVLGGLSGGVNAGQTKNLTVPTNMQVGNNNKDTAFSGTLTGGGSLTKIGAGTLTLSPASGNNYTGGTTVNAGTLNLANAKTPVGTGSVTLNGGTLRLGNLLAIQNNPLGSAGSGTLTCATGIDTPTIGGLFGNFTIAMPSNITGLTLNVVSGTQVYAGTLADGAPGMTVTKIGGGAQVLGNATYTGVPTNVNAGALSFSKQTSYNGNIANFVPANFTVASGSALGIGVGDLPDYFDSAAIDTVLTQLGSSDASTGLKPGAQIGLDTTNATGGTFTRGTAIGNLSGGNSIGLAKIGAGILILDAANTYTGTTTVYGGTLRAGAGQTTAFGPATSASLAFGPGSTGVVQLNGNNMTIVGLDTNATTAGTPAVENGSSTNATLNFNNSSATSAYAGVIRNGSTGTLAVTMTGAGMQRLTGSNTYTGGTTVTAGTLSINAAAAVNSQTVTLDGGTLLLDKNGTFPPITATANGGTMTNNSVGTGGGHMNIPNDITGTGNVSYYGYGDDRFTRASYSLSGDFIVRGGGNSPGVIGIFSSFPNSTIDLEAGVGNAISGIANPIWGGLKGPGALALKSYTGTLSIGNNNKDTIYTGVISQGTTGLNIAKIGNGTLTFTNTNTYTGTTTINAGKLNVTGSLAAASAVTVNAGGKLGGSNPGGFNINGPVAVAAGASDTAAGAIDLVDGAIGNFGINNTLALGGTGGNYSLLNLECGAGATGFDSVTTNGLTLGNVRVNLTALGSPADGTYTILTAGSGLTDGFFTFDGTSVAKTIGIQTFTLSTVGNTEQITVRSGPPPVYHWTGASGTDNLWSNAANWNNNVPGAGKTAVFADSSVATQTTDIGLADVIVAGVTFNASVATGNTIASISDPSKKLILDNGSTTAALIDVTGTGHQITAPVSLVSNLEVTVNPSSQLTINGVINGSKTLTKKGDGTLVVGGTNTNFNGATTIAAGTLRTTNLYALGDPGNILFPPYTAATVTVQSGGTLHVDVPGIILNPLGCETN